ncbi:MAG: hypothetical protein E6K53_12820 [Gammaproteobacteria bacterium]|nr:MAG: hypothetical protein E6K53_12820 [Gammaproteobacteria bacterium]
MNMSISHANPQEHSSLGLRYAILAVLVLVMACTRINHFAPLPDASWAVFFVAGFYLRRSLPWAFALLMAEAVLIDYAVITGQGMSFWDHYCVSAAYWFLVPAYLAMWYGGAFLAAHYHGLEARALGLACASFLVALALCYLVSNGSFYWLSASVPAPRSMSGWMKNLGDWFLPYLRSQGAYFGVAVTLHALAAGFAKPQSIAAQVTQR